MTDAIKSQDYRQRAAMMRLQAEHALSPKGRFVYQELSTYWDQMADMADNAMRLRGALKDDNIALLEDTALCWPPKRAEEARREI